MTGAPQAGGSAPSPRRKLGPLAIVLGFLAAALAQRLAPIAGPPLYDGVIVEDPYVWLSPPAGHSGGAHGVSQTFPVQGGRNPDLQVGTSENPPQIGVFAGAGYLILPPGTSSISVSIQPVPPPAQPPAGVIAGNVYRVSLTNQSGQPVTGQPSGGVTVELRGPLDSNNATIERFTGSQWVPVPTDSAGEPNMYAAVVTDFGDFALVAQPGWTPAPDSGGGGGGGAVGPVAPGAGSTAGSNEGQGSAGGSNDVIPIVAGGMIAAGVIVLGGLGVFLYTRPRPVRRPASYRSARPPAANRASAVTRAKPLERKRRRR